MTPEERELVADLFDRLAQLEGAPRDAEAERAIKDGLRQAPNAVYPLVQTVLVQDEALKRADARIQELEASLAPGGEPGRPGGFLDNMRSSLFGERPPSRSGSVPSVRPGEAPMGMPPGYSGGGPMAAEPPRPGGSFLGTAAAAAAGMIGGSFLLDSIRGMMGQRHGVGGVGQAQAGSQGLSSPWADSSGGNLARDAGLGDIGRSPAGRQETGSDQGSGLLDNQAGDNVEDNDDFDGGDDSDFGGDDGDE
jgi:hypothetical protein